MQQKNWQHNPHCSLCELEPETAGHLLKDCIYTQQAWQQLTLQIQNEALAATIDAPDLKLWLNKVATIATRREGKRLCGILLFFWWGIWKERNRRLFQHSSMQAIDVVKTIREDLSLFEAAAANCN